MLPWIPVALLLAGQCAAQTKFQAAIDEILARPTFANASVGVQIRKLGGNIIEYTHNEHLSLLPASNLKLITATIALAQLGSDFQYKTPVLATGKPDEDGTLHCDLYLQGSGDPSLTSDRLAILAKEIADSGIKNVTGNIIGDSSRFDNKIYGVGWAWDDEPYDYNPQIAALTCDRNVVNVSVVPALAEGSAATIRINDRDPKDEPYVTVVSTVKTAAEGEGSSDDVTFDKERARNNIFVSGTIPLYSEAAESQVPIEDPPMFAAHRFALALRSAGVHVSTDPVPARKTPAGATELRSTVSEPLSHLLPYFLKNSDNLYGELFFKTIGSIVHPDQPGSTTTAGLALNGFLDKVGLESRSIDVVDGSGLSRFDSATANFFCDLLAYVYFNFPPTDKDLFYSALPISGSEGTIEDRFPEEMDGQIHAKTGSLTRVSSLSGYMTAKNGIEYVFSILMNQARGTNGGTSEDDSEVTKGQNDIVEALFNY